MKDLASDVLILLSSDYASEHKSRLKLGNVLFQLDKFYKINRVCSAIEFKNK